MSAVIKRQADDRKAGCTLEDLSLFLAECDRAGIAAGTPVRVSVGFRSQLQWVEASG